MFNGKIIRNESTDPKYKIKFSYVSNNFAIQDGEALYIRKSPLPSVVFEESTLDALKQAECEDIIKKIELELGKTVIEHIISTTNDRENLRVSKNYSQKSSVT